MNTIIKKLIAPMLALVVALPVWLIAVPQVSASTLRLSPAAGNFNVGDTIEVDVLVDTEGLSVNALEVNLVFSAETLEVIAPSIGESILGIYAAPPKYDNKAGTLRLVGGIPGGITTAGGVITKIGFRAKAPGQATVRFSDKQQVLLNNGRGSESLKGTAGATFQITMPAGMGPIVTSGTNPDQTKWYSAKTVELKWDEQFPAAEGYSYVYSTDASATPDDVSEGKTTSYSIPDAKEGLSYFFVKALRGGEWGPTTRFILRSDFTPPNEFPIEISPYARTKSTQPLFQFSTTDQYSGVDRYELRLIPTNIEGRTEAMPEGERFFSVDNPYVVPDQLMYGSYQVVVRAYDKAGNIKEAVRRLEITTSPFWFISNEGMALPFGAQVTWRVLVPTTATLLLLLIVVALFLRNWYEHLKENITQENLPESLKRQLAELRRYKLRYGKLLPVLLLVVWSATLTLPVTKAAAPANKAVTSYSADVNENELFFVSGRTNHEEPVKIMLTSPALPNGAQYITIADQRGDWLYRHNDRLPVGQYQLTVIPGGGAGLGETYNMVVTPTNMRMGHQHMPYLTAYAITVIVLLGIIVLLIFYIVSHAIMVHRHRKQMELQIRHAEDAVKRGFYSLRKDIEAELILVKQAKQNNFSDEQLIAKERQIEEDLKHIESIVEAEFKMIEEMVEKLD